MSTLHTLKEAIENTKHRLLAAEHIAAHAIDTTNNEEARSAVIRAQRALYVAYDLVNVFPDEPDRIIAGQQESTNQIRASLVRWLSLASDEELEAARAALAHLVK